MKLEQHFTKEFKINTVQLQQTGFKSGKTTVPNMHSHVCPVTLLAHIRSAEKCARDP